MIAIISDTASSLSYNNCNKTNSKNKKNTLIGLGRKADAFHQQYGRIFGRSVNTKNIVARAHKIIDPVHKILGDGDLDDMEKALGLRQQARANLSYYYFPPTEL